MNQEFIKTKTVAVYISIVAMLSVSAIAIPMQAAQAQVTETEEFLIRFVGAVGQVGLVNVAVNNVAVLNNVEILKNVAIPVVANVQANVPVTICGIAVLSQQAVGCRTVNDAQLDNNQVITIPIQGNQ